MELKTLVVLLGPLDNIQDRLAIGLKEYTLEKAGIKTLLMDLLVLMIHIGQFLVKNYWVAVGVMAGF